MQNNEIATKIPVFCYHRVISDWHKIRYALGWTRFISVGYFDKQMKYIAENGYRTISCDEIYDWYKGNLELPKKTVMLTFDDAFYEVYYKALPILKKYDLKATIFTVGKNIKPTTSPELPNLSKHFIGQDVMDEIAETYPNVEFQGHTYGLHRKYDEVHLAKTKSLEDIKKDYKKMDKMGFTYSAHPYGYFNEKMAEAIRESNVKMAFAYDFPAYATKEDDIYNISRIKISGNILMKNFIRYLEQDEIDKLWYEPPIHL